MRLPVKVLELDNAQLECWNSHFKGLHDRPRYVEEGIWRRTQDSRNADQSGWTADTDQRRRIVHYRYRYDVLDSSVLSMVDFYLYFSATYPDNECESLSSEIFRFLDGWEQFTSTRWARGDLRCVVNKFDIHPEDIKAGRPSPEGYRSIDVCVTSVDCDPSADIRYLPWHVLAGGMRIKDKRGEPRVMPDLAEIADYLPFQVEVGCGTSVEAGIPPLHRLHEIYRVTGRHDDMPGAKDPFVLGAADLLISEVLGTPEAKFHEFTEMFRKCFLAEPTPALLALKEMSDAGYLVGPVITNNFDVLCGRTGLEECFVRRYDESIPPIPLLPEARSLLVVGNHADRRKVQARARERGMKIFYLDPEGFWIDGRFAPYPLEGVQDGEVLCQQPAAVGLPRLATLLKERVQADKSVG